MLEETKLKPHEQIKCELLDDYQVFYLSRQKSQGGGLAVGVNKIFESTFISEGDDDTEVISVLVVIGSIPIRIIVGYGVQENAQKEKKEKFWDHIEKEIVDAEKEEQGVILQMDGNLHAGRELIKEDPNPQNNNGKLFMQFLQRNPSLIVVNSLDICDGTITRKRETEKRTEQAVLDFFVVNEKIRPFLKRMIIDEKREYCLSNFAQIKKNKRVIESDHNGLLLEMNIEFYKRKPERHEMFNLKNRECQETFKKETEQNTDLLKCFQNEHSFESQAKSWYKIFNSILHKCFRKVRICEKKNKDSKTQLMEERINLKKKVKDVIIDNEMKAKLNQRIVEIEEEIGEELAENFHKEIIDTIKDLGGDGTNIDGSGRTKMWRILKKKIPKVKSAFPIGKKDQKGNMITNHVGLKKLYMKTYKERLRNRPIKNDFEELKNLKMLLFNLRTKLCKSRNTQPWKMEQLEAAIKTLKKGKARDPNGWVNDIFMNGNAGENLKKSILIMFNKIKSENCVPSFIKKAEIATIYKGKGEKCNLENDRGIFIVTVFRNLLMKLVYRDIYETINESMSDSQIGGRKGKNIRNHIWVLNSVINDTLKSKNKKPIDVQIYDYKQCFDSLWLEESLNDLYDGGLKDEKLNLIHSANKLVSFVVKTPVGKTKSEDLQNLVMQGDVFGSLLCSKQVDLFGKECLEDDKCTYLYKNKVKIPPLTMVDDVLCISECGFKSVMVNSYMESKTSSKKLQFSTNKCKKMHIGKTCETLLCHSLYVDKWSLNHKDDNIEEICIGKEKIQETNEERYLGDIISKDGKNLKNIQARISKGKGIIKKICSILEDVPFGKLFFEVAIILRNTLLVSTVLCNSEAWFNLSKAELDLIETVDTMLLRKILNTPKTTPKEMLFLELGVLPLRQIIKQRRLSFLKYILDQSPTSIIFKVFEKQCENRNKKDWVSAVITDLEEIGLHVNFEDIQKMKNERWKSTVKQYIKEKTFSKLKQIKETHSKVKDIKYSKFEMQDYLLPNDQKMTKEEAQNILKMRSKMTNLKAKL